ncbi:AzlD domain-containing protein [Thermodesulfobacteriota bacterium]
MGLVTYLPRFFPLAFLAGRALPNWAREWLDLIPVAVLSALLIPSLLTAGEPRHLDILQARFLVAFPTFIFAWKTESLGGTVIFGMLLFWLAGLFL